VIRIHRKHNGATDFSALEQEVIATAAHTQKLTLPIADRHPEALLSLTMRSLLDTLRNFF
jgi:hypothetical protein